MSFGGELPAYVEVQMGSRPGFWTPPSHSTPRPTACTPDPGRFLTIHARNGDRVFTALVRGPCEC
jgi:hypothetical protein